MAEKVKHSYPYSLREKLELRQLACGNTLYVESDREFDVIFRVYDEGTGNTLETKADLSQVRLLRTFLDVILKENDSSEC